MTNWPIKVTLRLLCFITWGKMSKMQESLKSWLSTHQKKKETISNCLMRIVQDQLLAFDLLEYITQNPRQNKANFRFIMKHFPKKATFQKWLKAYTKQYEIFIRNKWAQAQNIEDILSIIPNFSPWALRDRFGSIDIGKIPSEFQERDLYHDFLNKIYNSTVMKKYRQFKSLECDFKNLSKVYPEAKKIDWFDLTKRGQFLSKLLEKIIGHPFIIRHNKHKYQVRYLCNPFSSKMVFHIKSDTKRTYILKMASHRYTQIDCDSTRKEVENQAIRADSPYSNALMEFYLKLNKCPHVSDILYYTDVYEAVLYKEQKGKVFTPKVKPDFITMNTKYLKDANRLGIYVNDISPQNFMWDKSGQLKIIDIGHASFANPLTQGIPGLTFTFGNLCGQDYLTHFGVLSMED